MRYAAGPLVAHLREAIALNRARRAEYAAVGGWRAGVLSRLLVGAERALVPAARALDRQAAPFERAGVPVVSGALRPMTEAPPADAPVVHVAGDARRARRVAARALGPAVRDARRHVRHKRFAEAGDVLAGAARELRRVEADARVHLALAEHVVASAAVASRVGAMCAGASGGRSAPVTARFVRGHLALVGLALRLDAAAHAVRARGCGLFVHDLPPVRA